MLQRGKLAAVTVSELFEDNQQGVNLTPKKKKKNKH